MHGVGLGVMWIGHIGVEWGRVEVVGLEYGWGWAVNVDGLG